MGILEAAKPAFIICTIDRARECGSDTVSDFVVGKSALTIVKSCCSLIVHLIAWRDMRRFTADARGKSVLTPRTGSGESAQCSCIQGIERGRANGLSPPPRFMSLPLAAEIRGK